MVISAKSLASLLALSLDGQLGIRALPGSLMLASSCASRLGGKKCDALKYAGPGDSKFQIPLPAPARHRREDDVEIASRVSVARIELHGPPQMLDRFVARAVHRQCSAEMPVRTGGIRSESGGLAKFTDGLVDVPFLGERDAKRVVQLGGIGNDGTKICAASDHPRLPIRELAQVGHFARRRR